MSFLRRYLPLLTIAAAVTALYFYDLNGVGALSSDEPRYAAIGETMARTGDIVTPELWGAPWFEKPPLLYWMTAIGSKAGLSADLAGRVPVVVLSLIFLAAFLVVAEREFGRLSAGLAGVMLSTSAGWLAYSDFCLTDLPLAVFLSLAAFLTLPLLRASPDLVLVNARLAGIGACLGLGALAKGLVPFALAIPFFWYLRFLWRRWWIAACTSLAVALPWYVVVYQRNGYPFIEELFIKHHFERLYSASLQHVQPWYYYGPVILAGVFPWTPLILLLFRRTFFWDRRRQFLAAVFVFGFLVFSLSLNKLPGYLLPLIPCLVLLVASYFERVTLFQLNKSWLLACALLVACVPLIASVLPPSLTVGRLSLAALRLDKVAGFYVAAPLAVILLARRSWIPSLLALSVVASGMYVKTICYPVLDEQVSARGLWRKLQPVSAELCDGGTDRGWIYGLNFYRGSAIPFCGTGPQHLMLRSKGHGLPTITPTGP